MSAKFLFKRLKRYIFPAILVILSLLQFAYVSKRTNFSEAAYYFSNAEFDYWKLPEYSGAPFVEVNGNIPYFTDSEKDRDFASEYYSELDRFDRCGTAYCVLDISLMPILERGDISSVKPTGFQNKKYEFIENEWLYNRCHLIGYQLSGENANSKNLITGTRYMNIEGMLPFENIVADYIEETKGTVLYRVSPVFVFDELVARGVLMEAYSLDDGGESVCFCVFVYNVQPGVKINYKSGNSSFDKASYGKYIS